MRDREQRKFDDAANDYLNHVDDRYRFDRKSGLYRYKRAAIKSSTVISVLTLVLLCFTVFYTKKQWEAANSTLVETRKQAKLDLDQIKGKMSAVVSTGGGSVCGDSVTNRYYLHIVFRNSGQMISPRLHYKVTVSVTDSRDLGRDVSPKVYEETIGQIAGNGGQLSRDWYLPEFSTEDMHVATARHTVKVEGNYDFNDGFDDIFPRVVPCKAYIANHVTKDTKAAGLAGGTEFMESCDTFPSRVKHIHETLIYNAPPGPEHPCPK